MTYTGQIVHYTTRDLNGPVECRPAIVVDPLVDGKANLRAFSWVPDDDRAVDAAAHAAWAGAGTPVGTWHETGHEEDTA